MITVKFPALNKALTKDVKDLPDNDPRRGIIVLNNNAIVIRDNFCIVCNLYDYLTIEQGIEDDFELEGLQSILHYMDEKVFSNEFWNELTKGANMEIIEGNLFIENPKYSKDLHHKEIPIDMIEPLVKLDTINLRAEMPISSIAIPFGALKTIYDCLPADFKHDYIILEFFSQDKAVKFTFKNRKHFYGYLVPHYDAVQEGFRFECLESFISDMSDYINDLKEERDRRNTAPLPPISDAERIDLIVMNPDGVIEVVEGNPNQLKLVDDGEINS